MLKNNLIKALILLTVLILSSCGKPNLINRSSSFQVKVWLDRHTPLKTGDIIHAQIRADRPCYLYVYYLSGSGAIRQIFPDNLQSGNRIQPGVVYQIPPPGAAYQFRLTPPPVREEIIAVATLEPTNFSDPGDMDYSGVIPQLKLDQATFRSKLNAKLNTLLPTTWSSDTIYFTYGP